MDNDSTENLPTPRFKSEEEERPDRPLECSECKRPIAYYYTEIMGDTIIRTCMCSECPVLGRHLGHIVAKAGATTPSEETANLCCGSCGTTLQMVLMGAPLGCSQCYSVFGDLLINELCQSKKVAQRIVTKGKKSLPAHIGRAPGESAILNPSLRLIALNEALNETLSREDYEQAAWLRDQIKELTEHPDNGLKN